jgi:hypothetical protein
MALGSLILNWDGIWFSEISCSLMVLADKQGRAWGLCSMR